jgi:hypothetical protein
MVLEGCMHIGLGGMAGVPGLREEAEIGQLKTLHHRPGLRDVRRAPAAQVRSVRESGGQQDGLDAQVYEEQR